MTLPDALDVAGALHSSLPRDLHLARGDPHRGSLGLAIRLVRSEAAAVHQLDINDVRDALGVDAEAYAQQIFDFYASYGQPTRVDVMGSGKMEKFCREVPLALYT